MSLLSALTPVLGAPASDFYSNLTAQAAPAYVGGRFGAGPGYYDHWRADLSSGFFKFSKPVKGGEPVSPFTPNDPYTLTDVNGVNVNHNFLALKGIPIGYFIGASLSNFEQTLPEERKGSHCETTKAVLKVSDETEVTVPGRYPLQSSAGITYSLSKYRSPEAKLKNEPQTYAGRGYMTYGRATDQYAKAVGREQIISCADCLAANQNNFGENYCSVSGEMVFYVTELVFKGQKGLTTIAVKDLGIPEIGEYMIVVLGVKSVDLRDPKVNMSSIDNNFIPASSVNAHTFVNETYALDPSYRPFGEVPGLGSVQMLAMPAEVWLGKLPKMVGKSQYVALYNQSELASADMHVRHALLEEAMAAYIFERKEDKSEAVDIYEAPGAKAAQLTASGLKNNAAGNLANASLKNITEVSAAASVSNPTSDATTATATVLEQVSAAAASLVDLDVLKNGADFFSQLGG